MSAQILNLTDAAKHLNVPKRTLFRWFDNGQCPVRPIPGKMPRRWLRSDLDAWARGEYV